MSIKEVWILADNERWVPGYEGRYSVTDEGVVRSYCRILPIYIKQRLNISGYPSVSLRKYGVEGGFKMIPVHRLVASAFLKLSPGLQVNHKDGNKTNNNLENLEVVTASENQLHAYRLGLKKAYSGEKCPLSKYKKEEILTIRRLSEGGMRQREIRNHTKMSKANISKIINRDLWRDI